MAIDDKRRRLIEEAVWDVTIGDGSLDPEDPPEIGRFVQDIEVALGLELGHEEVGIVVHKLRECCQSAGAP